MPVRVTLFSLLCLTASAVLSPAHAGVMQFTPDQDNTLYEDAQEDLSNGSGEAIFMGRTGPNADSVVRRALVRFDVSAIPSHAVVDGVEVSFSIVMAPAFDAVGGTATLHRVTASWGEGGSVAGGAGGFGAPAQMDDATWQHRFYDTELWDSPGGDFFLNESASQGYGTDTSETLTFTSTPGLELDVQKWVKTPQQNFGWILIGSEGLDHTARKIDSRETQFGNPPLLTVDYHLPSPADNLGLELLTSDVTRPVVITNAGDGSERLFIVEQAGVIRIYDLANDMLLGTPFLDISALVDDVGNEQGLLGLVFHPDYENNGQFYVNYTYDPPVGLDRTRIAMYEVSAGDPNVADIMETVILEFAQDFSNHNGGDMHFDRDGYLVIATGDGGSAFDPNENAQNKDELLGKMLRIDVDSPPGVRGIQELCGLVQNYTAPPGNAFPGANDGCDEILHYGLRNPWRFSFDAQTEEMYIGDVGQFLWEEVDNTAPGETGINFGWDICEGAHITDEPVTLCNNPAFRDPIIEYPHSVAGTDNCSVTGGYVYRGGNANLNGRYVYADYCSARIWIATRDGDTWTSEEWIESPALGSVSTFGQDEKCELYVADFGNIGIDGDENVYRIVDDERIDRSGFEALRCQ